MNTSNDLCNVSKCTACITCSIHEIQCLCLDACGPVSWSESWALIDWTFQMSHDTICSVRNRKRNRVKFRNAIRDVQLVLPRVLQVIHSWQHATLSERLQFLHHCWISFFKLNKSPAWGCITCKDHLLISLYIPALNLLKYACTLSVPVPLIIYASPVFSFSLCIMTHIYSEHLYITPTFAI